MSDKPRFVCDANTLISAALFKGSTPDRALRLALSSGDLLLSRESLAELRDVLARPKFDRYLSRLERDVFLTKLIQRAILIDTVELVQACRDPDDDKYLALAATGQAACIVSGDDDLLALKSFRGIPIHSPAEFLASSRTP
jgi:hypothetical protein